MRILIIEDDAEAAGYLAKGLRESGHTADHAASGRAGLLQASTADYDAIVLDRMLPELDGLGVLRTLRASGIETPVLILSALGAVNDRVQGLKAGADDYLTKPFAFSELLARLEVLQKRRPADGGAGVETVLTVGPLRLDRMARTASRADRPLDLLPREFKLLDYLMRNPGRVVTRTMLLEAVWGYHFDPQTNVIDVHISRLRQKIDKDFESPLLETVRGAGYRLRDDR